LPENEFENDGVITEQGLVVLKEYLSEIPADQFHAGLKVSEIPTLFTVETLCKIVMRAETKKT